MRAPNMGLAPDALSGMGFACTSPAPALPAVGTTAQAKTTLDSAWTSPPRRFDCPRPYVCSDRRSVGRAQTSR